MSDAVLREATPDDDEKIRAFLAEIWEDNPKAKPDVHRWQYHNPFGALSAWVWDDGGRIVGHYANYPVPCLLDGARAVAGVAVDAAMAEELQGKRMFRPLSEALYADSATKGMRVSLAYPSNPIAVKGIRSAGWMEVARLRTLVLAVDDGWLARRFHVPRPMARAVRATGFSTGRGPAGEEISGVPVGLDGLWAETVRAGDIRNGIIRDEAWWQWRYADSPMSSYRWFEARRDGRLVGAAVVLLRDDFGGRFGYLLELQASDRDGARRVVRAITGSMREISGLATVAVDRGPLHRLATSAGLRALPRRLEPKGLWFGFVDNALVAGAPQSQHTAQLRDSAWNIGWGDLDHL